MSISTEANLFQRKKERISQVKEKIKASGFISVNELYSFFDCSEQTIRRDLQYLESIGEIQRQYGGVFYVQKDDDVGETFDKRLTRNIEAKKEIANKASSLISPNLTIAIDSSTTSYYLAKVLPNISLNIITNSFYIADLLVQNPKYKVTCIGGIINPKHKDLVLPDLSMPTNIDGMTIDMTFISCGAIDLPTGIYDINQGIVNIKKLMIKQSNMVVLLSNESKFNKKTKYKICVLSDIDFIVSDSSLDNQTRKKIHELNINVI